MESQREGGHQRTELPKALFPMDAVAWPDGTGCRETSAASRDGRAQAETRRAGKGDECLEGRRAHLQPRDGHRETRPAPDRIDWDRRADPEGMAAAQPEGAILRRRQASGTRRRPGDLRPLS